MTQPCFSRSRCVPGVSARCDETTDRSRSVLFHCRPFTASRVLLIFLLGITPAALSTTAAAQSMTSSVDCSRMSHDVCVNHVKGVIQHHIDNHEEGTNHTLRDHLINGGTGHGLVPFVVPPHLWAESEKREQAAAIERQCKTEALNNYIRCNIGATAATAVATVSNPGVGFLVGVAGQVFVCGTLFVYDHFICRLERAKADREAAEYLRNQESRNEWNTFKEEAIRRNQFNLDAVTTTETKDEKQARKKRDKARKKRDKVHRSRRPSSNGSTGLPQNPIRGRREGVAPHRDRESRLVDEASGLGARTSRFR